MGNFSLALSQLSYRGVVLSPKGEGCNKFCPTFDLIYRSGMNNKIDAIFRREQKFRQIAHRPVRIVNYCEKVFFQPIHARDQRGLHQILSYSHFNFRLSDPNRVRGAHSQNKPAFTTCLNSNMQLFSNRIWRLVRICVSPARELIVSNLGDHDF